MQLLRPRYQYTFNLRVGTQIIFQCPRNMSVFQTCLTFVWRLPCNFKTDYIALSDKCLTFHHRISHVHLISSDIFNYYASVRTSHMLPGSQIKNVSHKHCNQMFGNYSLCSALHTKDHGIWCDIGRFYLYPSGYCHGMILMCSYCYTASESVEINFGDHGWNCHMDPMKIMISSLKV